MDDEDVDDWDVEFGFADDAAFTDDDSNVDEADKLISSRIIGITADRLDPLLKETDWGDDFELGDANNSLFASKVKKSASIPEGLHNVWMEDTTTSTHRHLSLPRSLFRVHACTLTHLRMNLSLYSGIGTNGQRGGGCTCAPAAAISLQCFVLFAPHRLFTHSS